MGVVGKTVKVVGREASHVFGAVTVRYWYDSMRLFLLRGRRRCPACTSGRMFRFKEVVDGGLKDYYGCSQCEHFEPLDVEGDPEGLAALQTLAKARLASMSAVEFANAEKTFRYQSRGRWLMSAGFLIAGFGFLYADFSVWTILNLGAMSAVFFVQGLRASFRHWQFQTETFYQPGAFYRWLVIGKWWV